METPRIAILGAGANGANIGVDVQRAGYDVTFIDQWPAHIDKIRADGVKIVMPHETLHERVKIYHIYEVATFTEPFDYIFIILKAYDARWGAELMKPHLAENGLMVAIQNGMTAEDVADIVGPGRSLGCVLEISSGLYDPGVIIRDSPPDRSWFAVGTLGDGTSGREREVADMLRHSGVTEVMKEGILSAKWMKLVSNCTTIVTTSLLARNIKEAEEMPGMRDFMIRSGQEAAGVGEAVGYARLPILGLNEKDSREGNRFVETLLDQLLEGFITRDTKAGVLQDWEKKRKSEAGEMNGLVARKAAELGMNAPASRAVWECARRVEAGKLSPAPENFQLLLELEQHFSEH